MNHENTEPDNIDDRVQCARQSSMGGNVSPFFSIVIPVYNGETFIEECLKSVLQQAFSDWECIVVDDGSTDSGPQLIKGMAEKDSRIKLRRQANAGVAGALNSGIELARGKWIVRLDADDLMLPNRLKCHYDIIANNDVDLSPCSAVIINAEGQDIGTNYCHVMTTADALGLLQKGRAVGFLHPAVAYRKTLVDAVGGYRPHMCPAEDTDLWCRMVESGAKIVGSKEKVIKYRVHSSSISRSKSQLVSLMVDYVEHCMRQRLSNSSEPSLESYRKSIEDSGLIVKSYYVRRNINRYQIQQLVAAYSNKKFIRACFHLGLAMLVRPVHTIRKIVSKTK